MICIFWLLSSLSERLDFGCAADDTLEELLTCQHAEHRVCHLIMFLDRDEAKPLLALLWVLRTHSLENLKSIYLSLEHLVTIGRLLEGRLALIFVFLTGL